MCLPRRMSYLAHRSGPAFPCKCAWKMENCWSNEWDLPLAGTTCHTISTRWCADRSFLFPGSPMTVFRLPWQCPSPFYPIFTVGDNPGTNLTKLVPAPSEIYRGLLIPSAPPQNPTAGPFHSERASDQQDLSGWISIPLVLEAIAVIMIVIKKKKMLRGWSFPHLGVVISSSWPPPPDASRPKPQGLS